MTTLHNIEPISTSDVGLPILLRFDEAARLLRISRSRLYEMVAQNQVPGVVAFGRSRRISRVALEEWVAGQVSRPDDASAA